MSEPRGRIYLISRAPIDITYQHQIDFKSPGEQFAFWDSLAKYRLSDYTYIRRERRAIRVDLSFDDLDGVNYLVYQSKNDAKYYYCFITDRKYENENMTTLEYEIDVFQTYLFDFKFKPSYISQSHVDRWNADLTPKYSRTDEGLNYGSEYVTESAFRMVPSYGRKHGFYIVYLADIKEKEGFLMSKLSGTTISGNPIPYQLLIFPEFTPPYNGEIAGVEIDGSVFPCGSLIDLQNFLAESSLGEFVKQIVYIPYLPIPYEVRLSTVEEKEDNGITHVFKFLTQSVEYASFAQGERAITLIALRIHNLADNVTTFGSMSTTTGLENAIPSASMWSDLRSHPRTFERDRRFESKLLCFPYRYNVFTDWTSTPAIVKNEYLAGDKITVKGSFGFGFNAPRRFWIDNYRKDPEGREVTISQPIPLEQPLITDAYYSYMLQNRNQISANLTNAKISALTGVATGSVGGAMGGFTQGGVPGAIAGGVSGLVSSAVSGTVNVGALIRSENAKQADLRNLPDTISNANDTTLAIADNNTYITIYRKAICCEFEEQLAQYWHMYGYKVNRLETPNLRSRLRFNFIKTIGANIEGAIENNYLAIIKSIFDNGVTIWHYSETDFRPLDYTYENPEVNLL